MLVLLSGLSPENVNAIKRGARVSFDYDYFSGYDYDYKVKFGKRSADLANDIDFEKSDSEVSTLLILK